MGCAATRCIIQGTVEVYKRETREVIRRFFLHQLSFPNCIAALDAALAGVIPRLRPEELDPLRVVMLANNELVMAEMVRRAHENQPKSSSYRYTKGHDSVIGNR